MKLVVMPAAWGQCNRNDSVYLQYGSFCVQEYLQQVTDKKYVVEGNSYLEALVCSH